MIWSFLIRLKLHEYANIVKEHWNNWKLWAIAFDCLFRMNTEKKTNGSAFFTAYETQIRFVHFQRFFFSFSYWVFWLNWNTKIQGIAKFKANRLFCGRYGEYYIWFFNLCVIVFAFVILSQAVVLSLTLNGETLPASWEKRKIIRQNTVYMLTIIGFDCIVFIG